LDNRPTKGVKTLKGNYYLLHKWSWWHAFAVFAY